MLKQITIAASALAFTMGASAEVIFSNDFENGLNSNERTFSKWFDAYYDGYNYVGTGWRNTNNWGVHDGSQNTWASGGSSYSNPNMAGYDLNDNNNGVLGHIDGWRNSNGDGYHNQERSAYEITLDFTGWESGAKSKSLMFDFDSWIQGSSDNGDGFNVIAYNGGQFNGAGSGKPTYGSLNPDQNEMVGNLPAGWQVLDPILDLAGWDNELTGGMISEMQYDDVAPLSGTQLDEVSGTRYNAFTGYSPSLMAGTALFDLSGFSGLTTIRFSFGSNSGGSAEGINIDNVKVAGICEGTADGPSCQPGNTPGVPEPGSLALAALGIVALRRQQLKRKNA